MSGTRVPSLVVGLGMVVGTLAGCGGGSGAVPAPPPASVGNTSNLAVPASIYRLGLVDEHSTPTSLASFRGRVLVLAQFLTSCQEECPLTTGAFLILQKDLRAAGLDKKVVLAEMSVDAGRDTPARLLAYQAYTGAHWTMLTGTSTALAAFWHHFGIYYKKVSEESPAGIDWETNRPYAYDMAHSNGFMVFDAAGHLRFLTGALPNLYGKISPALRRLLDESGIHNLEHADPSQAWTIPEALDAIGSVLGRKIPARG